MHAPRFSPDKIAAAVALVTIGLLSAPAQAQVAKVNGVEIPQARLDMIIKMRAASKQPDSPDVRTQLRETLINQEVVAQEAMKKGLQKSPEVAAQLDLQRQETLVNAFVQDYMKANPVSDDAVKKEYERVKPTIPRQGIQGAPHSG